MASAVFAPSPFGEGLGEAVLEAWGASKVKLALNIGKQSWFIGEMINFVTRIVDGLHFNRSGGGNDAIKTTGPYDELS
jgi:hypothetical protein